MPDSDEHRLFPIFVRSGGNPNSFKAGYIDQVGRVAVQAVFDYGIAFSEGLGSVRTKQGKWGAIDLTGTMVIEPKSDDPLYFREGRSKFSVGARSGVMDSGGRTVVKAQYLNVGCFNEGLACAQGLPPKSYGFLNRTGVEQIPFLFEDARQFSEGVAPAKFGNKWGYIDRVGHFAIPAKFDFALPFTDALARVQCSGRWGFIGHHGDFEIEPLFRQVSDFHEHLAVAKSDEALGFINKKGKFAIKPAFSYATSFSEGLAAARPLDGDLKGFINSKGEWVIRPQFQSTGRFTAGRCFVKTEKEIGYIDREGQYVWRGPYAAIGLMSQLHL